MCIMLGMSDFHNYQFILELLIGLLLICLAGADYAVAVCTAST
jgi:hypothetical protein